MLMTDAEKREYDLRKWGIIRPICNKRARKLRRRGEHVRWSPHLNRLVWYPNK